MTEVTGQKRHFLNWRIIALQWRCLAIEPIIRTFLALVHLLFLSVSHLPILLYDTPTSSYVHNCLLISLIFVSPYN